MNDTLRSIVDAFAAMPEVTAIGLGGSRASGQQDLDSDFDLYLFTTGTVDHARRRDIARQFDPTPEIGNDWWGESDDWTDGESSFDVMFWNAAEFETGLRRVIEGHRPSTGYTTAFWFTISNMQPLFDRDGWLDRLKALATTPYPDELRDAIIAFNLPLLRGIHTSYRRQIELAIDRDDPVSVNHRIAAFLASVFDIVFAHTRTLHPGEKRQLAWLAPLDDRRAPSGLVTHIRALLTTAGAPSRAAVLPAIDRICDDIDAMMGEITS